MDAKIERRDRQHYVAVAAVVPMAGGEFSALLARSWPAVFAWLGARGVAPAGPPLIRYRVIDMPAALDVHVGIPVAAAMASEGDIVADALPAGDYAVARHIGHYDGLVAANAALQAWAAERGARFATTPSPRGEVWDGRVEFYFTDPSREPDPAKWVTEIAYLTSA